MTSSSNDDAPSTVLVDYKNQDWRGFLFVVHETHGLLLLYCTRKTSKGPHYQTPGGHIDELEFLNAAKSMSTHDGQLLRAGMTGAARELYEETGIDIRYSLHRMQPVQLNQQRSQQQSDAATLENEYKHRLFFKLQVTDADFPASGVAPMSNSVGKNLKLKLSPEHQGFTFVSDAATAAGMLQQHSGGKVRIALGMALESGSIALPASQSSSVTPTSKSSLKAAAPLSTGSRRKKTDKRPNHHHSHDNAVNGRAVEAPVVNLFPDPDRKPWWSCWFLDC